MKVRKRTGHNPEVLGSHQTAGFGPEIDTETMTSRFSTGYRSTSARTSGPDLCWTPVHKPTQAPRSNSSVDA